MIYSDINSRYLPISHLNQNKIYTFSFYLISRVFHFKIIVVPKWYHEFFCLGEAVEPQSAPSLIVALPLPGSRSITPKLVPKQPKTVML